MANETEYLFEEFRDSALLCEASGHWIGTLGCDPTQHASYYLVKSHAHSGITHIVAVCQSHVIWRQLRANYLTKCEFCELLFNLQDLWQIEPIINRKASK